MADSYNALHNGGHSDQARAFQAAMNRRLGARGLDSYAVKEDGVVGSSTLRAARKAAWALGAQSSTYEAILTKKTIPVGVVRMVRNPGKRTPGQLAIAKARLSQLQADRAKNAKELSKVSGSRQKFVHEALKAANNYSANQSAYHYLAGGIANLIYLSPSPNSYRSDCSQFASSVQQGAGLPALGSNGALWVSTYSMAAYLEETTSPAPGDFGMYGSRSAPHHVETYCALPGHEFIGHGSPPIDSLTPGRPSFYLKNPIGA